MNKSISLAGKSIILLGASFSTGNLGVSALAWSSIKIIRARWPDARIVLVGVAELLVLQKFDWTTNGKSF